VRASALERLAQHGRVDPSLAYRAARDPEPLVRLVAPRLADALPYALRADPLSPLLKDERRAVRIEAARVLAGGEARLPPERAPDWQRAAGEYLATLDYNADRPESVAALGNFRVAQGQFDEALRAFGDARRLEPSFVPAYVNAADALRAAGRDAEAVSLLEDGLVQVPGSADLHHVLGLAQVRLGQTDAALASLRRAVELAPDSARFTYVHAVAMHSTGRPQDAIRLLESALERWPADRDMLLRSRRSS
jgi:tetratricopeptide (TPR) repeat protein